MTLITKDFSTGYEENKIIKSISLSLENNGFEYLPNIEQILPLISRRTASGIYLILPNLYLILPNICLLFT